MNNVKLVTEHIRENYPNEITLTLVYTLDNKTYFECGIRFLIEFLNGDTYFKIHKEHHNLDRCRTQFKLVKNIEESINGIKKR